MPDYSASFLCYAYYEEITYDKQTAIRGIGNYPLSDALILAVHNIFVWTIVGLMVAWRVKPEEGVVTLFRESK